MRPLIRTPSPAVQIRLRRLPERPFPRSTALAINKPLRHSATCHWAPGEAGARSGPGGGSFDLGKAMRDFRDAVGSGRATEPVDRGRGQGTYVPPDLSGLPTTGYGLGNFEYESKDYEWDDYHRHIYMAIWRAWHNRLLATAGDFELWSHRNRVWMLEHTSRIRFTILRDGDLTGIAVELAEHDGGTRMTMRSRYFSRAGMEEQAAPFAEGLRALVGQMEGLLVAA